MITIRVNNPKEINRKKEIIEQKLNAKINLNGRILTIDADPLNEFEAQRMVDALNLGFSADNALKVLDEEIAFIKINIKDYANTKNLEVVRSRLIGTYGKTKKTIEEITKCDISIHENEVGIIGPAEVAESALTAVTNIIKGTKQANAYRYLERINSQKKSKNQIKFKSKKENHEVIED